MGYWASYIALSFHEDDANDIISEAKNNLNKYSDNIAFHNSSYMHMTLLFLGWLDENLRKQTAEILKNFDISSLAIDISGKLLELGFGTQKEYLAVEVVPSKEILKLHQNLIDEMSVHKLKFKNQEFLPHISLGRIHKLQATNNFEIKKRKILPKKLTLFGSISKSIDISD